jgi:flagellar motility protein MotE (MotC chaperone)
VPIQTNGAYDLQLDSHEDRLQRVESNVQSVVTTVAEIKVSQDYMAERNDEQFEQIMDKLSSSMDVISEKLYWTAGQIDKHTSEIDTCKAKFERLEAKTAAKADYTETLKKIGIPLLITAIAFMAGKFFPILWAWISK